MWSQFVLENSHFAINLICGLVFFATFWLYFDAWGERKNRKELIRFLGFLFLAISFLVKATIVESSIIMVPFVMEIEKITGFLFSATRIGGYLLVILSLILEPIQKAPAKAEPAANFSLITLPSVLLAVFNPVLALITGFLYLRLTIFGLESHLKKVSLAFFALSMAELLSMASILRNTQNIDLYNLVVPLGLIWILEHIFLLLSALILGKWVFGYLLKRFQTQLFMIFTSSILVIFLVTTISFTFLLLKNLEDETLSRFETDVKVLNMTIETKKEQSLSDAQLIAQNNQVQNAIKEGDRKGLADTLENFLLSKKQSFLMVVNESGQVLAKGEDKEKFGEILTTDLLVKKALNGESNAAVMTKDSVLAPEVSLRAAVPIKSEDKIIGAVITGTIIDNAFVDGMKKATGLEISVYGSNLLSATTLLASDNKTRLTGIKEENPKIKTQVLEKGENYSGTSAILSLPYFTAYLPLKDADQIPVGMISIGKPQFTVLQTAGYSIELTFIITAILLVLSIIPSFLVSRYLAFQTR